MRTGVLRLVSPSGIISGIFLLVPPNQCVKQKPHSALAFKHIQVGPDHVIELLSAISGPVLLLSYTLVFLNDVCMPAGDTARRGITRIAVPQRTS